MAAQLTHLALHVRDVDACVAFYQRFAGLDNVHDRRDASGGGRVVWLAEAGKERTFVFVLIAGGPGRDQVVDRDFSHLGFALESRAAVDRVAADARDAGCLIWPPATSPTRSGTTSC